ncbi:transcription elongation factor GreA [Patescibacteria group bacterium]|nr:transcription elongation factor GreA [Patescibacteria group bacterium]
MSGKELYVSKAGLEELKTELQGLLEERKNIAERIKEARELGDLSENAEYTEARTKQSFVEGRIAEIEAILKVAKIIDDTNRVNGRVALGSKITIKSDGNERVYEITGSNETNPLTGKISNESPIGQALMGHKKGDIVEINTPDGPKQYTITDVK